MSGPKKTTRNLVRLSESHSIKPFDCGDPDLNQFLFDDSIPHLQQLLAVTYLFETKYETIAYFSVLNDKITLEEVAKGSFNKLSRKIPHAKYRESYPSVKIGRFAVSEAYQRDNIGTALLDYIKGYFIDLNKTGCRFITVDAYPQAVPFYEKNGFLPLILKEPKKDHRAMFFDLYPFSVKAAAIKR